MAKQLSVDLRINADVKQAKQAMADLEKKINDIITTRTINVDDKSINEAKQAAIDLKHHLEEATNAQTGKINLNKFSSSLKQSKQNLQGLYNKIVQIGPAGQGAFLSLAQSVAKADTASINLKSKLGGLLITLKNTAKWQISSSILHGFMGAISTAYGYAQDLNESLNNIRIVTGQNIDQMSKFAVEANKAAKALSTSTTQYTDASLIYYQQGLSDEDVKKRTDATIKLANVSRQSAEEVSSQMTAIWNNFAKGNENLEYYEDVITKLGATTASSSSEIANGLSKFAAVADTVGLSYEKASAALATVVAETRQSEDIVGTAFKTMFARLEGLNLGETLEDGVDLNKYSKALEAVGVSILDNNGKIKTMNDILDETGAKWQGIGKEQQIALAQTVAGVRQYTQFISLMDNYDKVLKNEAVAKGSAGTVDEQAKTYAESWEAASARVNAALQSIYQELINDESFIKMLNGIESFISMINNIIKGLGGVKGILLTLGSIFMQYYAKEMPAFLQKTIQDLRVISGAAERTRVNTISGLDEIIQKMTVVDNSKALTGQLVGMQTLSKMYLELAQKRRFLSSTEVEAYEQKIREIEAYKESAEAIGKEVDKIKEEQSQLQQNAKTDLRESGFLQTQSVNNLDQDQRDMVINLIPEINQDKEQELYQKLQSIQDKIQEKDKEKPEITDDSTDEDRQKAKKIDEDIEKLKKKRIQLNNELDKLKDSFSGADLLKGFEKSSEKISKMNVAIDASAKKVNNWKNSFKESGDNSAIIQEMDAYIKKLKDADVCTEDLTKSMEAFRANSNSKDAFDDVMSNFNLDALKEGNDKYQEALERVNEYRDALTSLGVGEDVLNDLSDAYDRGELSEEQYLAAIKKLVDEQGISLTHSKSMSEQLMQFASAVTSVISVINAFQNVGNIWNDEDLSTGEKILQTMASLGTIIPMLVSLYNALGVSKLKNITLSKAAARSDAVGAAAKSMLAGQTFIATAAQEGLNAAMKANPVGAVIAAFVALIAVLTAFIPWIIAAANAETKEQQALKAANEELEKSKKAAEEAKQAYEDLKNKISNYKNAVDALKECTKGTQEWRDAFKEVLSNVNELITTFPQLLTYKSLFNSDGTLNLEALEDLEERASHAATATELQKVKSAKNQQEAVYDVSKANLTADLTEKLQSEIKRKQLDGTTTISSSQAQVATSDIIKNLLNNNINYNDSNAVMGNIEETLKQLYPDIDILKIKTISNEFFDIIKVIISDLNKFSLETENFTTTMRSSSNIMMQTLFNGDIPEEKQLEYRIAMYQKGKEITSNYNITSSEMIEYLKGNHHSQDILEKDKQGRTILQTVNEYINRINPNLTLDKEIYKQDENGRWQFLFKDSQGNPISKNFTEVKEDVVNAILLESKNEIIKAAEANTQYKDINSAVRSFLTNENYLNASISDLQNFNRQDYANIKVKVGDKEQSLYNENDNSWNTAAIKQYLLSQGYTQSDITEEKIAKWIEQADKGISTVLNEYQDKIPKGLQKIFDENKTFKTLNISQAEELSQIYSKMMINIGVEQTKKILTDFANSAGNEFNKIINALQKSDIDFTAMNVDEANEQLKNLGIAFQFTSGQFYTFKQAIQDIGTITIETAQQTIKTISSILDKLKTQGDILEDKDFKELLSLNPAIESFFTTLVDGTHMLTGEVQDFKTAMQTATINQIQQAIKNQEQTAANYLNYSNLNKTATSAELRTEGTRDTGEVWGNNQKVKAYAFSADDVYYSHQEQVQAALKVLQTSTNKENQELAIQLNDQIEAGKNLNEAALKAIESVEATGSSQEDFAKKAKQASEEAAKLTEALKETQYLFTVQNAGLNYEATENYANVLMELYEAEGLSKDAARALSVANQRLDRGLSDLNDNFETISKSLKNTNKASAEYAETIGSLRKSFADLLNIADGEELSTKWIEKWANDADKMKKILDGDTEAIQEFRESAFSEITDNVFKEVNESAQKLFDGMTEDDGKDIYNALQKLINQLDDGKISAEGLKQELDNIGSTEIGSKAVLSKEYTEALNTMLAQGLLTEQQLNDIFATIGYKPKVRVGSVDQMVEIPVYETTEEIVENDTMGPPAPGVSRSFTRTTRSKTKQIDTERMTQRVPVAQIESSDSATGNIEIVNAGSMNISPSYSSTTSGKSSDSSKKDSSSSSNPTTKAASHDHEVNRYSNEENAIKGLSEQYDRLNKVKDKAFGKSRIQAIEAEIKHLKALKEASGDYLDAIVGKGNADKMAKAIFKGENIGQMIANGSLGGTARADYNSLFSGLSASEKGVEYSAKDSNGNEWLVSDNYSLSGFNSLFGTNLQFNLDSYGNIQNKDAIYNLLQNLKNNENDAYSRVADPTTGSTTEYNKRMAYLEAIKERVDQFEETVDLMSEKTDEYIDYIASIQEKNAELITAKMEHGVNLGQKTIQRLERAIKILGDNIYKTAEAMTTWYNATLKEGVEANKEQANAYAQAFAEAAEKIRLYDQKDGYFNENAIDPASAAELLSSIEDGYDSLIDDLLNRVEEGKAYYGNVLDYWNNKLDKVNSTIQTNTQLLEHFQTVLNLLGRSADYEAIGTVLQGQLENAQSDYTSKKAQTDVAKQAYERAIQGRENLIAQGVSTKALEQYEEDVLQKALENYQAKADAMYSALEHYIETANAKFENEINRAFAESEDRLTGEWGSFDALDSAMQRQRSVSDEYLTKTNQLYESNTLLRKLSQDIDKTDSRIAKGKLKAFSDEIEAMKAQEKLSKTDLEIAKARYELLQAEIALEDARNAKSTVRLKRDSEGNYGYVYTADQDAVNDAEQNLADKQNNLYNLVLSQAQEYGEKMIQLRKEHDAEVNQLNEDYQNGVITSREEFEMQLQDIEKKYRELEYAEMQSYETAKLWLNRTGAEGQTEAWTNSFDEIITQHRLFNDESENNMTELSNNVISNLDELDSQREYFTKEAKVGNEELKRSVNEITRSTDELSKKVAGKNGLADSMNTAMITAQNLATAFSSQYDTLRSLITQYGRAADEANALYRETVNLINAQTALNIAKDGAKSVSWNNDGTPGAYDNSGSNGNTRSSGNNGNLQIGGDGNTSKITRRFSSISYNPVAKTGKYEAQVNYDEFKDNKWVETKTVKLPGLFDDWSDNLVKNSEAYKNLAKYLGFRSGGYTGSWDGPDLEENGKLAFLHQKELVLNADDTENMLSAVKLIRQISQTIDLQAISQAAGLQMAPMKYNIDGQTLQQDVTIHAEFPNVSDHNEIEEALSNLVNRASQYANRS